MKKYKVHKRMRKKGKCWRVLVSILLGTGLTCLTVGNILAAPYDWAANADSSYSEPVPIPDKDSLSGPGVETWNKEDSKLPERMMELIDGPSVTQVTLQERYHEDYKVYEESMGDTFFFYTNISNGGVTHESVILDIPRNIYCTVEKDGMILDYIPGQKISEYGIYVVKMTAVENESAPFSEQIEYRAIFRFRIQEKPPEEEQESSGGLGSSSGLGSNLSSGLNSGFGGSSLWQQEIESQAEGEVLEETREDETIQEPEESKALEESGTEETFEQAGEGENDGESAEETFLETDENNEQESNPEEPLAQPMAGIQSWGNSYKLRSQIYDTDIRRYRVTFENGRTLISNIPEGYIGPGAVEISVSDGEEVSLYRNDELVGYIPGNSLTESGYYRMDIDGQTWSFAIASSVGDLDYYPAPAGMEFTQVVFEGEPVELPSGRYLSMKEDGSYQITMRGEAGDGVNVILKRDTIPPEVIVNVKGGRADIQYLADDIADITLEKDGEIQKGFSGYVVNSPGTYRLMVTDKAGNVSSSDFVLKYHINVYGIMACVLGVLLIAGGIVFIIHVKKTVKVR